MSTTKPAKPQIDRRREQGPALLRREMPATAFPPAVESLPELRSWAVGEWLTVERALWGVLLLVAAALRFWDLGGVPLATGEAAKAVTSWQMVQGNGGSVADGPLLIYGNLLVFLALGANDASARLLPALAGTALVGLPFLLRGRIGRWGALIAASLLAVSPTLLLSARSVDSQAFAAAAALGVVGCLAGVMASGGLRWHRAGAVAVGLLLLSGRDGYTMVLILAGAATWASGLWRRRGERPALPISFGRRDWTEGAIVCGAILALGATGLLSNLHGLQEGLLTPFGRWLSLFRGGGESGHFQLQVLAVYEPLLLLFGMIGAVAAVRRGDGFQRLLVWWAVAALIVASLSGERSGAGFALALVPLALLAGPALVGLVSGLWATVPTRELATYFGCTLSLIVLFWLATQFFTQAGQTIPAAARVGPLSIPLQALGGVLAPAQMIVLIIAMVALGTWIGIRQLPALTAALLMIVLSLVTFHAGVLLNYASYASAAELPVAARTAPDLRALATDVAEIVDGLTVLDRPRAIRVAVADQALVGWYLRDQRGVSFGARPLPNEGLVIATLGADAPAGKFAAQRYRVQSSWVDRTGEVSKLWRWLTLREPPTPLRYDDVTLYVRVP